jgi:hypothetical protein
MDLGPVPFVDQRHELAAPEIADADDESGPADLFAQTRAIRFEDVRSMGREAPRTPVTAEVSHEQRDVGRGRSELRVDVPYPSTAAVRPHNTGLGEIEQLPEVPAQSRLRERRSQPERIDVPQGMGRKHAGVRREQNAYVYRKHGEGATEFLPVLLCEQLLRFAAPNRDRLDVDAQRPQGSDLAQDESVRGGRILIAQIRHAALLRSGNAPPHDSAESTPRA